MRGQSSLPSVVTLDLPCLVLLVGLSALPYLPGLGFYSDDWGLLAGFHFGSLQGQSFNDLLNGFPQRPVHGAYLLLLYYAFGFEPLAYHLVNTAVIAASVLLLYLLLLRLHVGRTEAFAIAVIFTILPQLSTVRMWVAANQIPLSMLFALCSMHAQLSFARSGRLLWLPLAIAGAALSVAAYEIFAPMIGAFALWLGVDYYRSAADSSARRKALLLGSAVVVLLAAAVLFKLLAGDRAGPTADPQRYLQGLRQLVRPDYDWRVDSSLNFFAAASIHFWHVIKGWAEALAWVAKGEPGAVAALSAAAIAALTLWRLLARASTVDGRVPPIQLLMIGAAAFIVGHAAFLIVPWILFSPTGLANRVLPAAAIGVAILFAAALALALRPVPRRAAKSAFAIVVALIAGAGSLRIAQVGSYWDEAPQIQWQVLRAARNDLAHVPEGSTVILDAICPYRGPAPVFETSWDTGGALSLVVGRQIGGDVVTDRMRATPQGLSTSMYEEPAFYRYGPDLYVYNVADRRLVRLTDAAAAGHYFASAARTRPSCPRSFIGHGVLLADAEAI